MKEKGRTYTALMLSGANQTPNPASLAAFEKALATAKREKAALLLNGHPGLFGDEIGWMETIRKNPSGRTRSSTAKRDSPATSTS